MNKKNKTGFTLVEIMVGILISTTIIIIGFQALNSITIGKVKLITSTTIEKESFFFMQKLFEEIKAGGLIDYEEYFNRSVVGSTTYASGHYDKPTGFGNFGNGGIVGTPTYGSDFYYCRSGNDNTKKMGNTGCVSSLNDLTGLGGDTIDYSGKPQRYGQYSFQFIDYNANYSNDGLKPGDENLDGNIIGDEDDEYLGDGPEAFSGGTNIKELYLISADKKKRTLFRWNIKQDPNKPNNSECNISGGSYTGTGCLGTVEFLRLKGKDWGMNHTIGVALSDPDTDGTQYDGVIDTWIYDPDFTGGAEIIAGSTNNNYWLPLFPENINVANFEIYAYPNKDIKQAWKDYSESTNISPYVRLKLSLMPSWKTRRIIKGKTPKVELSTTINLTDIYSR